MVGLSLCMIVKNEEQVLSRCLDSVGNLADEIILVDTGSKDNTKEIAEKYGNKVKIFDFKWCDDFSAARNFAFAQATMEYMMWLDADDILPESTRKTLEKWKQDIDRKEEAEDDEEDGGEDKVKDKIKDGVGDGIKDKWEDKPDVLMLKYATGFDEKGEVNFSYYRERILRRERGYKFSGRVHEAIILWGKIAYMDGTIEHRSIKKEYSTRNLDIYEKMKAEGELLSSRDVFYYARELFYHKRNAEAVENFEKFLQMDGAFTENLVEACRLAAYAEYRMGEAKKALEFFVKGLMYRAPGAELCCDIGKHFFDRGQWRQAIFWYENAAHTIPDEKSGKFVNWDCYGYLPCVQLSVCYQRIGEKEKALKCHILAGKYKPYGRAFLQNEAYFNRIK